MNQPSSSPTYEVAAFMQVLRRQAKPVFGQGWTVTKQQVIDAYLALDEDNVPLPNAINQVAFDLFIWEALESELEAAGLKVVDG